RRERRYGLNAGRRGATGAARRLSPARRGLLRGRALRSAALRPVLAEGAVVDRSVAAGDAAVRGPVASGGALVRRPVLARPVVRGPVVARPLAVGVAAGAVTPR
ncbi:hypothetical protein, partial [Amycolatopsis lexingtonensis]